MSKQVIYQEQQKTYFILILAFILIAFFLLFFLLSPSWFGLVSTSILIKLIVLAIVLADLVFFLCFTKITIRVSADSLSFGFGFMKKKFFWNDLKSAQVEDFNLKNYLGYGIRFGKDKSIAFVAQGGRGVRLKTIGKDYFFSCSNPEKLAILINKKINS